MFACFYIPDFPVQASLLPEPPGTRTALNRLPIAVLDGPANLPRVFATNSAARRAGIQTGMTKLQAEICPGIELRKRSLAEEESAQFVLLDCAAKFSPRVESTAPGAAILDLAGTEKLFGPLLPQNAQTRRVLGTPLPRAVHAMTAKAAEAGFDVRIAIAANPDTAFLAARGFSENTTIPAGDEAQRLASLPVEALPVSPEMLETLDSWGIRTFQSLAALPAVAVVERLGQEGLYIQKLARGAISRPLLTVEPNAEFAASFEFDDPVETLESIFFILSRLLQELCSRLLSTAQAATELRLTVGLNVRQIAALCGREERERQRARREPAAAILSEPSGESKDLCEHAWKLPVPTQDKNLLFSLLRLHLEQTSFSAPVRLLRLEVVPVKPRLTQGNLFAPPSPEAEKLEVTLERIRGVVGATDAEGTACVGAPRLLDTHRPGSFTLQRFSSVQDANSPAFQNSSPPKTSASKKTPMNSPVEPCVPCGSSFRRTPNQNFAKSTSPLANSSASPQSAPVIALRIFRPALETTVELDGKKPHFVHLWSRNRRVLAASGPWSTSGNWWNASAWTREEWDIALQTPTGLGFYRIYRDRLRRQWFVEGVFD